MINFLNSFIQIFRLIFKYKKITQLHCNNLILVLVELNLFATNLTVHLQEFDEEIVLEAHVLNETRPADLHTTETREDWEDVESKQTRISWCVEITSNQCRILEKFHPLLVMICEIVTNNHRCQPMQFHSGVGKEQNSPNDDPNKDGEIISYWWRSVVAANNTTEPGCLLHFIQFISKELKESLKTFELVVVPVIKQFALVFVVKVNYADEN